VESDDSRQICRKFELPAFDALLKLSLFKFERSLLRIKAARPASCTGLAAVALPQKLTEAAKYRILLQLHTVNHDRQRSPRVSRFWNYGTVFALAKKRFYPFLKSGMRFSRRWQEAIGIKVRAH
jgi:hypothetical protein